MVESVNVKINTPAWERSKWIKNRYALQACVYLPVCWTLSWTRLVFQDNFSWWKHPRTQRSQLSHVVDSGWGYTFNLILVSFYFFHCFSVKSQKIFPSSFPSSLVSITQVSPLCLTLSIFYLLRILTGSFWESTELGKQLGSSPVPQKPRLHHCLVFCPLACRSSRWSFPQESWRGEKRSTGCKGRGGALGTVGCSSSPLPQHNKHPMPQPAPGRPERCRGSCGRHRPRAG